MGSTGHHSRPLRAGDKVQDLADRLGLAIRTGRLAAGQRLVEADLAAHHGVSRNSLRETLRILSAEGLVSLAPNRGAAVCRLTLSQVNHVFEARLLLEPALARQAAERATGRDACRERFELASSAIWDDDAGAAPASFLQAAVEFENALADLAGNEVLARAIRCVPLPLAIAQVAAGLGSAAVGTALTDLRNLADAIASGRAEAAAVIAETRLTRLWISVREGGRDLLQG